MRCHDFKPNDKRVLERVMIGLRHAQHHLSAVYPAIYQTAELITRAKCDLMAGNIAAAQSHLDAAADQLDGLSGIADPPHATTECALADHKLQGCIDRRTLSAALDAEAHRHQGSRCAETVRRPIVAGIRARANPSRLTAVERVLHPLNRFGVGANRRQRFLL